MPQTGGWKGGDWKVVIWEVQLLRRRDKATDLRLVFGF